MKMRVQDRREAYFIKSNDLAVDSVKRGRECHAVFETTKVQFQWVVSSAHSLALPKFYVVLVLISISTRTNEQYMVYYTSSCIYYAPILIWSGRCTGRAIAEDFRRCEARLVRPRYTYSRVIKYEDERISRSRSSSLNLNRTLSSNLGGSSKKVCFKTGIVRLRWDCETAFRTST